MASKWYRFCVACVAVLVLSSVAASAHHGNASFDTDKRVVLKGKVTEWLWANPHCFLKFDVTENGETKSWNGVLVNPTDIQLRGFRRTLFKPGDEVEVTINPSKDGSSVGGIVQVVMNGQKF